ncbi:cilia- and flagella-associated protein 251-like [Lineus longissimus]|uniref:cilia- and flagella-associated protein 251-like n=1 Tax=Lineus longissimus TaxID=88925 RepID=UPI002B4E6721
MSTNGEMDNTGTNGMADEADIDKPNEDTEQNDVAESASEAQADGELGQQEVEGEVEEAAVEETKSAEDAPASEQGGEQMAAGEDVAAEFQDADTDAIEPTSQSQSPKVSAPPSPKGSAPPSPKGSAPPSPKGSAPPSPKGSAPPSPKGSAPPSPKGSAPPSPKGSAPPSPKGSATPAGSGKGSPLQRTPSPQQAEDSEGSPKGTPAPGSGMVSPVVALTSQVLAEATREAAEEMVEPAEGSPVPTEHSVEDKADQTVEELETEEATEQGTQTVQEAPPSQKGTPPPQDMTEEVSQTPKRTPTPQGSQEARTTTPQQTGSNHGSPSSRQGSHRSTRKTPTPGTPPGGHTPQRTLTPQASKPSTPQKERTPTPGQANTPSDVPPNTAAEERRVPTAPPAPELAQEEATPEKPSNPLSLVWSFGMNRHIPVLNMTDGNRKMIMYANAHTGILYDIEKNTQKLLQGHSNAITCTCVSQDKRWVVTADKGQDNTAIIWDSNTGFPVRTIFEPHKEGTAAIAITPNAKYLATLSAGATQVLAIWDWTTGDDNPVCTAQLKPSYGVQNYILFNPEDTTQLVTNSDSQVIFYSWKNEKMQYFAPPLSDRDFNKPVGKYSQTIYQRNSSRALTATSIGNLVVWDSNKPLTKVAASESTPDKKALKLVKMQDRGLNVLTTTDNFIVMGDANGHVKFFDQTLKLANWYQDFNIGPINSLSFAFVPEFDLIDGENGEYPPDATISARKFVIRDYAVGTMSAVYGYITSDGTKVDIVHRDHDAAVFALASHPFEPKLAMGSYSGLLKIWDYERKLSVASRYFERGNMIRSCAFDPRGEYLAVGFINGSVRILDAITLEDEVSEPFRYARDAITHCVFSHDSQYLATADAEFTVSVFKASTDDEPWVYLGRHRAHYKLIKDVIFTIQLDSNLPRLMSLGEDRMLVEYDLVSSSKDDLRVSSTDRIEQSAVPLSITMYPAITKEQFILTTNDQFKFKLYNSTTKMCRKTLLGPTYGTPLEKMIVIPGSDTDRRYLAYITSDKVGLSIMPLTGNPHNAMTLIAHPGKISNLACSYDGTYIFTAGGADATAHMWSTNYSALEAQGVLGGEDLIPFYGLLDGGRDGELFAELEDYFYYAQIRSQDVNTMDTRQVSTHIPLSEVPFVMRAMGFYPSEQEIMDMLNEVKYSKYVETGKYIDRIDLGDFIKLYVNHRPAFGLSPDRLKWAFEVLGLPGDQAESIERGEMLDLLQSKGEHMTEYELAEYLTTLLGCNPEGGSSEQLEFDPTTAGDLIADNLPFEISAEMFANEVLGFSMYSDVLNLENERTLTGQTV